jgi:hypothetical protein
VAKKQVVENEVAELVRKAETDYITGTTTIGKYVEFSQYENTEKITAYLNSKHTSGDTDSLGREKPFFNIGIAIRNIWYRATDLDRKNIRIKATKLSHRVPAFVASIHLQEWMRKSGFGAFLNEWGLGEANYGSAVLKFVEKGDELLATVIPWNRVISDTIDFENNPKIEILWMTAAQLKKNENYDKEMVEKLLDARETRETTGGETKDNKSDYIKLYEVHGELPKSYLTDKNRDEDEYVQQMHVVSFVAKKEKGYNDFTLFKGKERKDPYMITHLIKEDGRAQSIGAIEYTFEAQWMANHSQKLIKDQLDLASKLITQTADGNFVGQNILTGIEVGDILIHSPNNPLTRIDTHADIVSLQNFGKQWEVLAKEISSTPDAMRGENQPSGTAWRQVEALRQESHSLFEQMIESKSLDVERMMREYVIPHLKKKMDTTDELAATLDTMGIQEFDAMYVPNEVIRRDNAQIKKTILSGQVAQNMPPAQLENDVKKELSTQGNQRFVKPSDLDNKTWKEALKDLEWEVMVDASGEETDNEAVMDTLNTIFMTLAKNPAILQDPNMKLLFNKILEQTDAISPLELSNIPPPPPPQMPQQPSPVGGSNVEQPVMQGQTV